MPGAVLMVLGDATNLAFRISSIAGRESRAAILATQELCDAAGDRFVFGPPETVTVKGRSSSEIIRGVIPGRPRSPTESDFGEPL
jgi:class 3 adenylate cyclase